MKLGSMTTWSFYDASTGLFLGRKYSGLPGTLAANTPGGSVAIEGTFDRHTQRVDITTGKVVQDESLSAPRDQFERRQRAMTSIAELERRQLRPLREFAVDPANEDARARIADIDARIAQLRDSLRS